MNPKIRVAINGFGRIGRAFFKLAISQPEIELIAINDLGDPENLAYLLKFDSVYGKSDFDVDVQKDKDNNYFVIDKDKKVLILSEKDPQKLPWENLSIDVVIESTGLFTKYKDAQSHVKAGAKKVIISAPAKSAPENEEEGTILIGVNEEKLNKCNVISNASCTTNSIGTIISVLDESLGIEKAILNTVHAYTATQSIVDLSNDDDMRKGRAGAMNIIPFPTGAAEATTFVFPSLEKKFDGIALRVPVPIGAISDLTFVTKRDTSAEEVNSILQKASKEEKYQGILSVTDDPVVSQDILGNLNAAIVDSKMTRVVGGNLVKILSWYDNEMGYAHTLIMQVLKLREIFNNK